MKIWKLKLKLTAASHSSASDSWTIGFIGTTRMWVGAWGLTSRKAMHWNTKKKKWEKVSPMTTAVMLSLIRNVSLKPVAKNNQCLINLSLGTPTILRLAAALKKPDLFLKKMHFCFLDTMECVYILWNSSWLKTSAAGMGVHLLEVQLILHFTVMIFFVCFHWGFFSKQRTG